MCEWSVGTQRQRLRRHDVLDPRRLRVDALGDDARAEVALGDQPDEAIGVVGDDDAARPRLLDDAHRFLDLRADPQLLRLRRADGAQRNAQRVHPEVRFHGLVAVAVHLIVQNLLELGHDATSMRGGERALPPCSRRVALSIVEHRSPARKPRRAWSPAPWWFGGIWGGVARWTPPPRRAARRRRLV